MPLASTKRSTYTHSELMKKEHRKQDQSSTLPRVYHDCHEDKKSNLVQSLKTVERLSDFQAKKVIVMV